MLTLHDIMGDNMQLQARQTHDKLKRITVTVIDENTDETMYEETVHPYAWEALVYFAKQVISENERMAQRNEE